MSIVHWVHVKFGMDTSRLHMHAVYAFARLTLLNLAQCLLPASLAGMDGMRHDPSKAAIWINAGVGTQLAAFLVGLQQRPAFDGTHHNWGCAAVAQQACYRAVVVIKSLLTVLIPEEGCHGVLPVRLELAIGLCKQLCGGQCEWLGVVFGYACAGGVAVEAERQDMLEQLCSAWAMMTKFLEQLGEPPGHALGGGAWAKEQSRRAYAAMAAALSKPWAGEVVAAVAHKVLLEMHGGVANASHTHANALLFALVGAVGRDPHDEAALRMRMARSKACRAACVLALNLGVRDGLGPVSFSGVRLLLCLTMGQEVCGVSCKEGAEELLPALFDLLLSRWACD